MNFKSIAIFLTGAAIGAVASYFFTKEKIEKKAQEDISAMEQVFKDKYECSPCPADFDGDVDSAKTGEVFDKLAKACSKKEDSEEPVKRVGTKDYSKYEKAKNNILYNKPLKYKDSDDTKKAVKKGVKAMGEPYIIGSEEYCDLQNDGWDAMEVSFDPHAVNGEYFYDTNGEPLSMDSLGNEAFEFMNSQADEDEVIYVRNDELGMIFEVTYDAQVPDFDPED